MQVIYLISLLAVVAAIGFDSGGSCETRTARRTGRAQILAAIPCDLTKQAYCNLPGTSYPWHAVRRFVHENQGLMKRMYGDMRHLAVLKTEFEENIIEEDLQMAALDRYSNKKKTTDARSMKLDKKNRRSDTIQEPHFRLQTTKAATSTTMAPPNFNETKDYEVETNLVLNSSSSVVTEEAAVTTVKSEAASDITTTEIDLETEFDVVSKSTAATMEGQLFQDTLKQTTPSVNVRGM